MTSEKILYPHTQRTADLSHHAYDLGRTSKDCYQYREKTFLVSPFIFLICTSMKKYTLLWHIFELEPRAYDYLASYVARIDTYAQDNTIAPDILEDIKYNIIEKLYTASSPISETFVMNIAQTIGEPEAIFENRTESEESEETPQKNLLERWFGNNKPMIWGVAYWISKSLNIPVSIVRLILLWMVFIYGTSIWLYPLLALFVPFQDKKSTTGQTGNLFFEIIRVLIWLGVLFSLSAVLFGSVLGLTLFSFLPALSNQALQSFVPGYIYPLVVISLIALVVLIIGSLGALIKKYRVSKTVALIATTLIIGSMITAWMTSLWVISRYNANELTIDTQILTHETLSGDTITIHLFSDGPALHNNYLPDIFGREFSDAGALQSIELLASPDDHVHIEVVDSLNILPRSDIDARLALRSRVTSTLSGATLDILIPNTIFTQIVPFSFAQRVIRIRVPSDKQIAYDNNSQLRFATPRSWIENTDGTDYQVTCEDTLAFRFHPESKSWRCANTISRPDERSWEGHRPVAGDEEALEDLFNGLGVEQAQELASSYGWTLRVVEQDGIDLDITEEYHPGRLNVEVEYGKIVDLEIE